MVARGTVPARAGPSLDSESNAAALAALEWASILLQSNQVDAALRMVQYARRLDDKRGAVAVERIMASPWITGQIEGPDVQTAFWNAKVDKVDGGKPISQPDPTADCVGTFFDFEER